MGILSYFKNGLESEIHEKGFEQSSCDIDCGTCNFHYPPSVKVEADAKLWNSTNPFDIHILIPTGKTDWEHDALTDPSMPFVNRFNSWLEENPIANTKLKLNVCSLPAENLDEGGDILILPQFVWVKNIKLHDIELLGPLLNQIVQATTKSELPIGDVNGMTVDLDANRSWMFLCSHRKRDKRCGVTAPIIKKEIDCYTRDFDMYRDVGDDRPGGIQVAFVNHIGGHKYAANLIIYLRDSGKMVWLALIKPNNVKPVIDECVLGGGKIWVEHTRLIQKSKPIDW